MEEQESKMESAIDQLLNQNRFLDKKKFFEKQKKLEQLRRPYQQKVFYKHTLRQEGKFPFRPLKEEKQLQEQRQRSKQAIPTSEPPSITNTNKRISEQVIVSKDSRNAQGRANENHKLSSLPESVPQNLRAATHLQNRN